MRDENHKKHCFNYFIFFKQNKIEAVQEDSQSQNIAYHRQTPA